MVKTFTCVIITLYLIFTPAFAGTLKVGHGKKFQRIEDANKAAKDGDNILVYPHKKQKLF